MTSSKTSTYSDLMNCCNYQSMLHLHVFSRSDQGCRQMLKVSPRSSFVGKAFIVFQNLSTGGNS